MNGNLVWLATLATVVLLFGYEAVVAVARYAGNIQSHPSLSQGAAGLCF